MWLLGLAAALLHLHASASPAVFVKTNSFALAVLEKEFRIDSWTVEKGLPQNTVNCLLQSTNGYLWIGTREGLVRYDGLKFTVFDRSNTRAFRSHNITALAEHPPGCLWVGTVDGLVRYQDSTFTWFALAPKTNAVAVRSICERQKGGVWLGTSLMPMLLVGEQVTYYTNYPGYNLTEAFPSSRDHRHRAVNCVLEDVQGTLWLGDDRGLVRLKPGAQDFEIVFAKHPRSAFRPVGVGKLVTDPEGGIWFGNERGLFRYRDERIERYDLKVSGFQGLVDPLVWDPQRGLWIRSDDGGISLWSDKLITHYRLPAGLTRDSIACITPDREGNLWVGTSGRGLHRLQPPRVRTFTTTEGLAHDHVSSIYAANDGGVWIATENGLNHYLNGNFNLHQVNPVGIAKTSHHNRFQSVLVDGSGQVWAGSKFSFFHLDGDSFIEHRPKDIPIEMTVQCLYADREGAIWVGTWEGLFCWKDNRWERFGPPGSKPPGAVPILCGKSVISLLEDAKGALWIGTRGGVSRRQQGHWDFFTTTNGLPSSQAGPALAEKDGSVWFCSPEGLIRFKEGQFVLINTEHGLFENYILNVLEDDWGDFWLNGHRGLQRVSKQALHAVADGKTNRMQVLHYGEADGMLSAEGTGRFSPNSAKSRGGLLWFPTTKGVVVVNPRTLQNNQVPPPVVIEQVVANGQVIFGDGCTNAQPPALNHHFRPGHARTLIIRYTAPSFVVPEQVRFRYSLEGRDNDWVEDNTNLRTAIYTDLRPGYYSFRVQAFNNHRVPSASDAAFTFYVAPHFYETWPFYVLCAMGVFGVGGTLHHYRMRGLRRIKELEHLHALDQERARIAKDMHDSLGADLTKIALLTNMAEVKAANEGSPEPHLQKVSALARSVVDGISELVWSTNPRHNTLESLGAYLREYASDLLESAGISGRFEFPTEFPAHEISGEIRRHLFLAAKEAINNAVKHAQASKVTLGMAVTDQHVVITIRDNGTGFEVEQRSDSSQYIVSHGNGLRNLKERIAAVGGLLGIVSAPGNGTFVRLEIPLRSSKCTSIMDKKES